MKNQELMILGLAAVALYLVVKSQSKSNAAQSQVTKRSDYAYDAAAIQKAQSEPLKLASLDPIQQWMNTGGADGSW